MACELDREMSREIGVKMMIARDTARLTREQLAEKAEIEANSIYRYETGKQVPNFPTAIRIAKGLSISVADLLPNDYFEKSQDDPDGVLKFFYQLDENDRKGLLRQMMGLLMIRAS